MRPCGRPISRSPTILTRSRWPRSDYAVNAGDFEFAEPGAGPMSLADRLAHGLGRIFRQCLRAAGDGNFLSRQPRPRGGGDRRPEPYLYGRRKMYLTPTATRPVAMAATTRTPGWGRMPTSNGGPPCRPLPTRPAFLQLLFFGAQAHRDAFQMVFCDGSVPTPSATTSISPRTTAWATAGREDRGPECLLSTAPRQDRRFAVAQT